MSFGKRLPNRRVAFFWNTGDERKHKKALRGNSFADFTCNESVRSARNLGMATRLLILFIEKHRKA